MREAALAALFIAATTPVDVAVGIDGISDGGGRGAAGERQRMSSRSVSL